MLRLFRRQGLLSWTLLFSFSVAPPMMLAGCSKSGDSPKSDAGKSADAKDSQTGAQAAKASANKLGTGRGVLEAMAAAYRKAKTYQDNGFVRLIAQSGEKKLDEKHDFAAAFVRPNKIHLDVYTVRMRSDGRKYHAFITEMPGQIVEKDAPEKLDSKNIYGDPFLMQKVSMGGPAGAPPQPLLLLEDKALEFLLAGAEEPLLSEPGEVEGRPCFRVRIPRPEGAVVFWIDRESFVLRRMSLSTESMRSILAQELGGEVESSSLVAEFAGAELDRPVQPAAFEFEVPQGGEVQVLKHFVPPHPGRLVGKKTPAFKFADDAGQSVTPESLAGKVAAILFWSPQQGDYARSLPDWEKLSEAFKNDKNVAVFAVCLDGEEFDRKAMDELRQSMNLHFPIYRDLEKSTPDYKYFDVAFLLGTDGAVQDYELVADGNLSATLRQRIERLLAGQSLAGEAAERYRKELQEYEQAVESYTSGEAQAAPQAKIADRTEPKTFKLRPLWKCAELKDPGNILVIGEPKKPPRLLVISPPNQVAEVGLDGKVAAVHQLDLAGGELAANLRAFTTRAGKTYVATFAGGQRLHLFNLQDQQSLSYPADALKNPHGGIADVELFDLDGDGAAEIYVGFWGVVGVHCVGLDGKRLWGNRSLANVARMAAGPADNKFGRRELICMNILTEQDTSLFVLDAQGKGQGNFKIGNASLRSILGADLAGDGNPLWCALGVTGRGELLALGFDLGGRELWRYKLPSEPPMRPIEPIVAGRLFRGGAGQWIFPCPDGSIHVLDADGAALDAFNYGAILQGLAAVEIGGKPALVVSSPNGLEAFAVE
ncbi:MAG: redoxin domain-containing protein [Pirellulales bacterium]|nr:redoxin domain-containing protein [Pirellulales bacterium]